MEDNKIKLSKTVMVIDVAYLNFVINDLKNYFERKLERSLQKIDLALFAMYLAMDAGIEEGENDVQILLLYDKESEELHHCMPCDVKQELDGVAFRGSLGEFSFMAVPSEGFVSRGELFLDLLRIILNSADVEKMVVVSFNEEYGEDVEDILKEYIDRMTEGNESEKDIIQFRMEEPVSPVGYLWKMLGYPLMTALGIKGEEL